MSIRLKVFWGCFFLFWGLELSLYLMAFADPRRKVGLMVVEGPLSLLVMLVGYLAAALWLLKDRRSRVGLALWLLAPAALAVLATVGFSKPPASPYRIEIHKSQRRLDLFKDDKLQKSFPVGMGDPVGDKEVMGDRKTPEGEFFVTDIAPSQFHKWLGLNYPSSEDAWRGRLQGRLMWVEWWYLRVQNLNHRIPYGHSPLGGDVGIHGGGSGKNWTLGCVALNNNDVDQLYNIVPLGTPVTIFP